MGIFLPGPRVEVGASWQKLLQDERTQSCWISFRVAAYASSPQHTLRVRPVQSGSGYWDRREPTGLSQVFSGKRRCGGSNPREGRSNSSTVRSASGRGPGTGIARREHPRRLNLGLNYYLHGRAQGCRQLRAAIQFGWEFSIYGPWASLIVLPCRWTGGVAMKYKSLGNHLAVWADLGDRRGLLGTRTRKATETCCL